MDITAAAIATIISSSVATIVTLTINRRDSINKLNDQLDDILKIGIQYPYLESPKFTETWLENRESIGEDYLRYENYCTLVFNYMETLCEYYKYNKTKIEAHLNLRDWIRVHKQCWEHPSTPFENADSYDEKFKRLINTYLT
jgi:hypothetical protein